MIWIEYYRLLFQNEAIAIQGTLFGLNLIGRKNDNRIQIMKSKILLSYNNTYLCIQKSYPRYKLVLNGAKLWKPYSRDLHRRKDITYWEIVLYKPIFGCWWHHLEEKKTVKSWFRESGFFIFSQNTKYGNIDWMTRYTSFQLDYNFLHFWPASIFD